MPPEAWLNISLHWKFTQFTCVFLIFFISLLPLWGLYYCTWNLNLSNIYVLFFFGNFIIDHIWFCLFRLTGYWNRFSAIYCVQYPDQQASLSKHLEAVRDIADAKSNWNGYHIDFKMLIAQMYIWNYMSMHDSQRAKQQNLTKVVKIYSIVHCQGVSASSIIQISIVQQACSVVSSTDVITAMGHTHLFTGTSQPSSPFVSSQNIKTKQVVSFQVDKQGHNTNQGK